MSTAGAERERFRVLRSFPSPATNSSIDLQSWVHLRSVFSRWRYPEQLGQPSFTHLLLWVVYVLVCNTVKVKVKSLSRVRLFVTPWTVARQAPPSMGFSRQECWSGLPFPSPGDLPYPGIEPGSPALQVDALPSEPPGRS